MKRPQTTYRLSNRQAKELLTRRAQLLIAIPVPPGASEDEVPMAIVAATLPIHAEYCDHAEYQSVPVAVRPITEGKPNTLGTQAFLGQIVSDKQAVAWPSPVILIECVVAELNPPTKQGHLSTAPLRWPGRIFHGETEITPTEADSSEG